MSNDILSPITEYLNTLSDLAAQTTPTGDDSVGQAILDSGQVQIQFYRVEVRSQGWLVAEHTIPASSGLNAINLVEREYGEPIQAEIVKVETGNGRQRPVLIAKHWHGYTFHARVIA